MQQLIKMNIYKRKIHFKYLLLTGAILIGFSSLWYTNNLVKKLETEEQKKVKLWAEATSLVVNPGGLDSLSLNLEAQYFEFVVKVLENNETVPVIIIDENDNLFHARNIDSVKINNPKYLKRLIEKMKEECEPIEINMKPIIEETQYLYYTQSTILVKLTYYPFVQLLVILLFILVAYFAFSSSRKAEQNQVWVGLSKETAHQLGTPISSLMAWMEMLKLQDTDEQLVEEFGKDVNRLEKITERFSKIGSKPILKPADLNEIVDDAIDYLKTRSSKNIDYQVSMPEVPVVVPVNASLFEWVLENTCKNAMDAIDGRGTIKISIIDNEKFVFVDISDTGKGIPRSKHKTIFKPGYTTKERGWGLGLSLTKRIVEEYHGGKIFVSHSEPGKGTTIRVILNVKV